MVKLHQLVLASVLGGLAVAARDKPRLFVLTDIGNEPDDAMSMVRLMTYSNQIDIEGLAATSSTHLKDEVGPNRIVSIINAYGKVRDNLAVHEEGYPSAEYLLERTTEGLPIFGMGAVGDGFDSPASKALIAAVDRKDKRPLWVTAWGGPNVLAQALYSVRATRSRRELARFVSKIRVYTISDQDDSGPWMRKNFPDLFYVVSPGINAGGGYHHCTWSGISGDKFHGRFGGADWDVVTNEWLGEHIQVGPLGAEYPDWEFLMEGDTPSYLNLVDNGLSVPEKPNWGGWGGRYELYTPRMQKWFYEPETRPIWSDAQDEVYGTDGQWHTTNHATIWRWRDAYQNDFASRMAWTLTSNYSEANHPPVPRLDGPSHVTAKPGERVHLKATTSSDPDGDELRYKWYCYEEPGTRGMSNARDGVKLPIDDDDKPEASLEVKTSRVMPPGNGTMHIILEVTDTGSPPITRYQRMIIDVQD